MGDGKLAGIISIGDVVKHRLEDLESETTCVMPTWPRVKRLGVDHIGAFREACISWRNHEDAL
jgi:hypothetical protein